MTEPRRFHLLAPESLPRGREECVAGGDAAAALDVMRAFSPDCPDAAALALARRALARQGLDPRGLTPVGEDPHESDENRANDRAFGIVRVRGDVVPILAYSTLQGFVTLLEEALAGGAHVSAADWGRLRAAFRLLFAILRDGGAGGVADLDEVTEAVPPPPAARGAHSAFSRWTRGHHTFMVLIQGLVTVFSSFHREVESGRHDRAGDSLRAATRLMAGSAVALHFTGDFEYSDYERDVRPTLMPPIAPSGLTGLYWRDHEYLIKFLTKVHSCFTALDPSLRGALHAFRETLKHAYEAHKTVCASFVGTQQPSLLMATRTEQAAVDTLDHFMRVRLNLVQD